MSDFISLTKSAYQAGLAAYVPDLLHTHLIPCDVLFTSPVNDCCPQRCKYTQKRLKIDVVCRAAAQLTELTIRRRVQKDIPWLATVVGAFGGPKLDMTDYPTAPQAVGELPWEAQNLSEGDVVLGVATSSEGPVSSEA